MAGPSGVQGELNGSVEVRFAPEDAQPGDKPLTAERDVESADGSNSAEVSYLRMSSAAFERTRDPILSSVRFTR